jgi:hypothetical protein
VIAAAVMMGGEDKASHAEAKEITADIANTPLLEPATQLAYVVRRRLERLTNAVRDKQ